MIIDLKSCANLVVATVWHDYPAITINTRMINDNDDKADVNMPGYFKDSLKGNGQQGIVTNRFKEKEKASDTRSELQDEKNREDKKRNSQKATTTPSSL